MKGAKQMGKAGARVMIATAENYSRDAPVGQSDAPDMLLCDNEHCDFCTCGIFSLLVLVIQYHHRQHVHIVKMIDH